MVQVDFYLRNGRRLGAHNDTNNGAAYIRVCKPGNAAPFFLKTFPLPLAKAQMTSKLDIEEDKMATITIGGTEYRRMFSSSGAGNIDLHGYPYQKTKLLPWFWFAGQQWYIKDERVTPQAKTLTDGQPGNFDLLADGLTPRSLFPRCIVGDPITGHSQNAVGLSCLPYQIYYDRGIWKDVGKNFWISYLANAPTPEGRIEQTKKFANASRDYFDHLEFPPGVMLNGGCPNVAHKSVIAEEIIEEANILRRTGRPIGLNLSVIASVELALEVAPYFDLIAFANTISHQFMVENDNPYLSWWWSKESILKRRGYFEGGWAGNRCRKYALRTIRRFREQNKKTLVLGGNSILWPGQVDEFAAAGADLVEAGNVAMIRPVPGLLESIIARTDIVPWRKLPLVA